MDTLTLGQEPPTFQLDNLHEPLSYCHPIKKYTELSGCKGYSLSNTKKGKEDLFYIMSLVPQVCHITVFFLL